MMRKHLFGILVLSLASPFTGCGLLFGKPAIIAFEDRDDIGGLVAYAKTKDLTPTESLAPLTGFYDHAGNKVGAYTPTKFKVRIGHLFLYDDYTYITLHNILDAESVADPSLLYADFINAIEIYPPQLVPPGEYKGLAFKFGSGNDHESMSVTTPTQHFELTQYSKPEISVVIPGYDHIWPDIYDDESDAYEIRYLGGSEYHFIPRILFHYNWPEVVHRYTDQWFMPGIYNFVYLKGSTYRAILPGFPGFPATYDSMDASTLDAPAGICDGDACIVLPFEGVVVPFSAKAVRFTLSWDLDGIIEVYDNYTPADKSDDIVVFARNFWERLSLIPTIME